MSMDFKSAIKLDTQHSDGHGTPYLENFSRKFFPSLEE